MTPESTNFHYTRVYYYSLPTVTSAWTKNAYHQTMDLQPGALHPSNTITSSLRNKNIRNDPESTNFHYTKVYYNGLPTVKSAWPKNAYHQTMDLQPRTLHLDSYSITSSLHNKNTLQAASYFATYINIHVRQIHSFHINAPTSIVPCKFFNLIHRLPLIHVGLSLSLSHDLRNYTLTIFLFF